MKHTKEDILALNPCRDGLRFAEQCGFDAVKIYNGCPRGDWLLWLLRKVGVIDKPQAVTLAIVCAERVLTIYEQRKPGDFRPRQAIEAAKAWVENPTEKNRQAAAAAAAATYASAAAASAAYAAYAASADAAYATYAAAASAAAAYSSVDGKKERQGQADKIREIIPCPFE